jgi:hypothetical protein
VIDRRREEQAVLAIEALGVGAIPPRLAVARAQVLDAVDARDAATLLQPPHVLLEEPLAAAHAE